MKTIYKYIVGVADSQVVEMPKGAKILDIQLTNEFPTQLSIWAIVDTDREREPRIFKMIGTGHRMDDTKESEHLDYISTIQCFNGLVVHVFEYKIV